MKYQITGTVHHVGPIEIIGAKGFQKRTFTIADGNDKWPNNIPFELQKDAVERAPALGDKIEAEFYLQGREWNGKHYLSAKCVDWQLVGQAAQPAPMAKESPPEKLDENGDSVLPF